VWRCVSRETESYKSVSLQVFIFVAWNYIGCFYLKTLETFKWHPSTCRQASRVFEILNDALRGKCSKLPSNIFFQFCQLQTSDVNIFSAYLLSLHLSPTPTLIPHYDFLFLPQIYHWLSEYMNVHQHQGVPSETVGGVHSRMHVVSHIV
jgi:hypothetical protein